jgi:hypothetical protein
MPAAQLPPVLQEFSDLSVESSVRTQLNNLIAAVFGIAQKLDADAGVTDTNYTALWGSHASQVTVHK